MVLLKKDHADIVRSHIKARHKVEQKIDKHEQLLLNIAQVTKYLRHIYILIILIIFIVIMIIIRKLEMVLFLMLDISSKY